MFERTSALAAAPKEGGRASPDGRRQVQIGEVRSFRLVQVAAFHRMFPELERAMTLLLGEDLPAVVGEARTIRGRLVFKTAPEQLWVVTPDADDLGGLLQSTLSPATGALTSLTHSRTRLYVEGIAARTVLATAIALDFHPEVFGIGSFALTGLHHTPVLLHRSAADRYELYVLRTFAHWIWEWLADAARPYGYEVA